MRTRKNFIATRLNDAEKHHFLRLVEQSGCSRYEFIRRLIMGAELKKVPDEDIRSLSRSVDRIGNNINQIAHLANARGYVEQGDLEEVRLLQKQIVAEVKGIKQKWQ
jgi:hypothetical protein